MGGASGSWFFSYSVGPGIEIVLSGSQCLYLLSHLDGLCNSVIVCLSLSFIRAVGFSELVAYLFSFGIIYIL